MTDLDFQPDTREVMQMEADYSTSVIPVCVTEVKSPIRVQELPRKQGATRTITVPSTSYMQVLKADHFRAKVTLMSQTEDFYVAFNSQAAEDVSRMSIWPARVPFPITVTSAIFVRAFQNTTPISITTELWAVSE